MNRILMQITRTFLKL